MEESAGFKARKSGAKTWLCQRLVIKPDTLHRMGSPSSEVLQGWRRVVCGEVSDAVRSLSPSSNEFFSVHPQIILCPSILKPLGSLSYKMCCVQQAGEYASFPKVPAGSSGQESLPEIHDRHRSGTPDESIYTSLFPHYTLSSVPRAPSGSCDGEYAPMCCERATSIIRTLLWFLLDKDEITHMETALSIIIISSKPEVCPAPVTVLHLLLLLCPLLWLCSSFLKGWGPSQPFDLRRSRDSLRTGRQLPWSAEAWGAFCSAPSLLLASWGVWNGASLSLPPCPSAWLFLWKNFSHKVSLIREVRTAETKENGQMRPNIDSH